MRKWFTEQQIVGVLKAAAAGQTGGERPRGVAPQSVPGQILKQALLPGSAGGQRHDQGVEGEERLQAAQRLKLPDAGRIFGAVRKAKPKPRQPGTLSTSGLKEGKGHAL